MQSCCNLGLRVYRFGVFLWHWGLLARFLYLTALLLSVHDTRVLTTAHIHIYIYMYTYIYIYAWFGPLKA